MRRRLTVMLVFLAGLVVPAGALGTDTGIRGVVLNTTCPGPCSYPPQPAPPYSGDGLTVWFRSLPGGELAAVRHPKNGHFNVALAPGLYRVRADVEGKCWDGEHKRVRVHEGELAHVRLHVNNGCVV